MPSAAATVTLVGSNVATAVDDLTGIAVDVTLIEVGDFRPLCMGPGAGCCAGRRTADRAGRFARRVATSLPTSPRRWADPCSPGRCRCRRRASSSSSAAGRVEHDHPRDRFVATLQPGVRGADRDPASPADRHRPSSQVDSRRHDRRCDVGRGAAPDPGTIDLAEAPRIVGGGAGLDSAERFEQLAQLGVAACQRRSDARHHRPRLDRHEPTDRRPPAWSSTRAVHAFGISGAVQHTTGLGQPDHIISINTGPALPDDAARRPGRRRRRQRSSSTRVAWSSSMTQMPDVRRRSSSAPARAGVLRSDGRRPCRALRGRCSSAARSRAKNMYGGVVYPRILDRLHPALVGGGAGPALDHPPLDDDAHGRRRRSASTSAATRGRAALQRRHGVSSRLRPLARRQGRGRRAQLLLRCHGDQGCCATADGTVTGVRTDRPDGDLHAPTS